MWSITFILVHTSQQQEQTEHLRGTRLHGCQRELYYIDHNNEASDAAKKTIRHLRHFETSDVPRHVFSLALCLVPGRYTLFAMYLSMHAVK